MPGKGGAPLWRAGGHRSLSRGLPGPVAGPPLLNGPRTVLIVSPHFPPSSLAGVHRARHLAKHLPASGWRPVVLRAAAETYGEPNDPALATLSPADLEQVATPALPLAPMRRLGIGDIGLRAYPYLRGAMDRLIRAERPAAVLITGFPFYPMMLAGRIRRQGVPVTLDFQDPWVSAFGAAQPRFSKAGLAHRIASWLEPRALRHAAFVTSVSAVQNQEMAARYPWLDAAAMAAIPIGGDPDDFEALRRTPIVEPKIRLDPSRINLNYVGAFLPRAGPLARQIFRGLSLLKQSDPALADRLRLNFVGTSNQPAGGAPAVEPIAREEGVADQVFESPARVPFLEALSLLATADGLLLIGSDEPHYTASKIYPALMSGRPFLSLFHPASSSHAILGKAGGGVSLAFEGEASQTSPVLIAQALKTLAASPERLGQADPAAYEAYTASAVAARFAAIFDRLSSR